MTRPIFCGNFEFDARSSDLERLFKRYGKVDRVDLKSGFAFIYMEDERDAEYAIRALDRTEFGRKGRRLRVEWTKHERVGRKSVSVSRKSDNIRPSKTLFVINFPPQTQTRDLERHFDPYGKIVNVRIRKNFGFVQYESQEDATKALDATNMSKLMDRVISVEYSSGGNDDNRRNGYSPDRRDRDRSPDRRRRSPSPYKRLRRSPDYGIGSSPLAYRRERGSPVYGNGSSRSPRRVDRGSPDYDRRRSLSPRRVDRGSPDYDRKRSLSPRRVDRGSPDYDRKRSLSPRRVDRSSLDYNRKRSLSPRRDKRASPEFRGRGRSRSRSPRGGDRNGNGYGRQPSLNASDKEEGAILDDRNGDGYGRQRSLSVSDREEGAILDDDPEPASPIRRSDSRERPRGESRSPINDRHSVSPSAQ
ncbi:hypothetical protein vseg_001230 [Gypsophila vaccaria]